MYFTCIRY